MSHSPTSFEAWYNAVVHHKDTPVIETPEERVYRYRSALIGKKVRYGLVWGLSEYEAVRQAHEQVDELWWERYASPGLKEVLRNGPTDGTAPSGAKGR